MNVIKKPVNIVDVTYARTKASVNTDSMGMREMQQRVFAKRDAQHLLVKAPPASGKSRALMFVALDKVYNQGRKKVIVAVPERSIGASFSSTNLTKFGFYADWEVKDKHNLCDPGSSQGKVGAFIDFLNDSTATTLVCTHATLRFAFEKLDPDLAWLKFRSFTRIGTPWPRNTNPSSVSAPSACSPKLYPNTQVFMRRVNTSAGSLESRPTRFASGIAKPRSTLARSPVSPPI